MAGRRLLVVFLDGVGIGEADSDLNPFLAAELPRTRDLFGGIPTLDAPTLFQDGGVTAATVFPVDATLGHDGTPQSGTGQTSLLTGRNGPDLFGRHFGPWVPTALRPIVRDESFLRSAVDAGRDVGFLNAYPEGWPGPRGGRRIAGPPLAASGAGVLTRTHHELGRGEAVASEITNDGWIRHLGFDGLPRPTARDAGATLARLAAGHDLSLYAHYATDTAGHRGGMEGGVAALERVDAFLGGLVDARSEDLDVLICSDHGNIEDVRGGHTRNPSLGALIGRIARETDPADILDLTAIHRFVVNHPAVRPTT